jgi:hypothetical protein
MFLTVKQGKEAGPHFGLRILRMPPPDARQRRFTHRIADFGRDRRSASSACLTVKVDL